MYVGYQIIGADGIEKIVEIKLSKDEQIMFDKSVQAVNGLLKACKEIDETLLGSCLTSHISTFFYLQNWEYLLKISDNIFL